MDRADKHTSTGSCSTQTEEVLVELMNLVFIALRQLHQALIVCNVPDLWMYTSTFMRMSHARGPTQTDDASTLDTHNPDGRGRRGSVTTNSPNPLPVEAVCTPLAHTHRLAPRASAESGAVPFALGGVGGARFSRADAGAGTDIV